MTIETARSFFLWCSILNYGILVLWVLVATLGRGSLIKLRARLFRVSEAQFDVINVCGITLYKMLIFLFNIVPCIALYLIK